MPMMTCRSCGKRHAMELPPLSPRSLLFALLKLDIIDDCELKRLDKEWMRYRKAENLNALGHLNSGDAVNKNRASTCN